MNLPKTVITLFALSVLFSTPALKADWEEDLTVKSDPLAVQPAAMNESDPYEAYNRQMFAFNMGFHDLIGKPVVDLYRDYMPTPAQTGLNNFFSNLETPLDALNSFLQGKGQQGFENIMRFSLNSTFGLLGILDVATPAGLEEKEEDFGQTLYVWGVWNESSFIMMPFIGPYTTRGLFGKVSDGYMDPVYYLDEEDRLNQTALFAGDAFLSYAKAAPAIEGLKSQPDPYIFMRESYLQYRTNLIYDGHPPQPNLDDFNFE